MPKQLVSLSEVINRVHRMLDGTGLTLQHSKSVGHDGLPRGWLARPPNYSREIRKIENLVEYAREIGALAVNEELEPLPPENIASGRCVLGLCPLLVAGMLC